MNSKNILFFLLLMIIYINVFMPLSEENRELKQKIIATKNSIEKDVLYMVNQDKIKKDLNQSEMINLEYEKNYFFQEDDSQIFNLLQKEIKNLISKSSVDENNINWGEVYKSENLILFPLSVRVSGSIEAIGDFFKSIDANQKIYIKDFTIQKTKKFYFLKLSLYGMKRD